MSPINHDSKVLIVGPPLRIEANQAVSSAAGRAAAHNPPEKADALCSITMLLSPIAPEYEVLSGRLLSLFVVRLKKAC